ncbi:MAG: DUF3795 domain-containing protein [Candidatus Treponema excrementipullorum]|nr:DUF3795 domain-containing protein [Candidatus Treponema excrementipullorum]
MKGFERENQFLSLCGLNCGLCPMLLGRYCGGCGNGNQSCSIARCSIEHSSADTKIAYCYECGKYPCEKYVHCDEADSFITHKNQKRDLAKARQIGIEAYNREQQEKIAILNYLLTDFNDGRKKTLYCVAVNLLELQDIQSVMEQISTEKNIDTMSIQEKSALVAALLKKVASERGIELKLRKNKSKDREDTREIV